MHPILVSRKSTNQEFNCFPDGFFERAAVRKLMAIISTVHSCIGFHVGRLKVDPENKFRHILESANYRQTVQDFQTYFKVNSSSWNSMDPYWL